MSSANLSKRKHKRKKASLSEEERFFSVNNVFKKGTLEVYFNNVPFKCIS